MSRCVQLLPALLGDGPVVRVHDLHPSLRVCEELGNVDAVDARERLGRLEHLRAVGLGCPDHHVDQIQHEPEPLVFGANGLLGLAPCALGTQGSDPERQVLGELVQDLKLAFIERARLGRHERQRPEDAPLGLQRQRGRRRQAELPNRVTELRQGGVVRAQVVEHRRSTGSDGRAGHGSSALVRPRGGERQLLHSDAGFGHDPERLRLVVLGVTHEAAAVPSQGDAELADALRELGLVRGANQRLVAVTEQAQPPVGAVELVGSLRDPALEGCARPTPEREHRQQKPQAEQPQEQRRCLAGERGRSVGRPLSSEQLLLDPIHPRQVFADVGSDALGLPPRQILVPRALPRLPAQAHQLVPHLHAAKDQCAQGRHVLPLAWVVRSQILQAAQRPRQRFPRLCHGSQKVVVSGCQETPSARADALHLGVDGLEMRLHSARTLEPTVGLLRTTQVEERREHHQEKDRDGGERADDGQVLARPYDLAPVSRGGPRASGQQQEAQCRIHGHRGDLGAEEIRLAEQVGADGPERRQPDRRRQELDGDGGPARAQQDQRARHQDEIERRQPGHPPGNRGVDSPGRIPEQQLVDPQIAPEHELTERQRSQKQRETRGRQPGPAPPSMRARRAEQKKGDTRQNQADCRVRLHLHDAWKHGLQQADVPHPAHQHSQAEHHRCRGPCRSPVSLRSG